MIEYEKKMAILHVTQDITQRKQVEIARKHYEARLESLVKISEFKTDHLEEMLKFALEEAVKLTDSKIGFFYFYDANRQEFTLINLSNEVLKLEANKINQSLCQVGKNSHTGRSGQTKKTDYLECLANSGFIKKRLP